MLPIFKFFKKKEVKRSVPADIDVFDRNKTVGAVNRMSGLKHPGEGYGVAWYLPASIKWRMLQDPQVFAAFTIWKMGVMIDGYKFSPAVDSTDKRYKKAKEFADLCTWNAENMQGSFHMKCLSLLDMAIWNHKAAVQVYKEQKTGRWKDKIVIDYLRILPNEDYRVRVDEFNRYVGLQSVRDKGDENIIPKEKFIYCAFRPFDDSPIGTNILWPVYDPWYQKQEIIPERLAHMSMFGSPSFWAEAPEGDKETDLLDADNKPVINPITNMPYRIPMHKSMLEAIHNFKGNGSGTVFPYGGKLNMIQAAGEGQVFRLYQDDVNNEIIKGILLTTLMTEQGANGSRASSQTGQVTAQLTIADGKYVLADAIQEYFCGNLIRLNYPEKDWDLIPKVTFGGNSGNLITSLYNAISALYSVGFFDDTQKSALCQMLNLPEPDPDAKQGQPTRSPGGAVKNADDNQKDDSEDQDNSSSAN